MIVTINISAGSERRLREKAAKQGQTLEAYLEHFAEMLAASGAGTAAEPSLEDWVAEFRAWAASHKSLPQIADDSRESVYAGRGE